MKKIAILLGVLGTFSVAQAISIGAFLAQGDSGISSLVEHFRAPLGLNKEAEKNLQMTIKNGLLGLHGGSLPNSVSGLSPYLTSNFKGVLDQDISKVSPDKFLLMINSTAEEVSKTGVMGNYSYYKCNYCVTQNIKDEGLDSFLSKVEIKGGAASYLKTKNYSAGVRALGPKLNLNSREADEILKALPSEEEKLQLTAFLGVASEGAPDQIKFGNFIKSLPDGVQNSLFTDTRIWTEALNENRGENLAVFQDIIGGVVKASKPTSPQEFRAGLKTYIESRLGKNAEVGGCWGLNKVVE